MKLLILITLYSSNVFSWGANGHRIVGEIAQKNINIVTQAKLKKILGDESLAHASVWADEIKSYPKKREDIARRFGGPQKAPSTDQASQKEELVNINYWHFVTIADSQTYETSKKDPNGDIVWAIQRMEEIIINKNSSAQDKKEAIRLLAHFIGDIHQPLHVGNEKDRGGNNCWVKWFAESSQKNIEPTPQVNNQTYEDLHSIWDSKIIDFFGLSYTDYAEKLMSLNSKTLSEMDNKVEEKLEKLPASELKKISKEKFRLWSAAPLHTWVNESLNYRRLTYPGKEVTPGSTQRSYCFENRNTKIPAENIPNISWEQFTIYKELVDLRLLQAGLRLAARLEEIL